MKSILLSLLSILSISFAGKTAFADVSCSNSRGYMVYAYPGARPDGSRIPVAEFDGPNELHEFMSCSSDYRSCQGKNYRFTRSNYGGVVSGPGLLEDLNCN